MKSPRIDFAHIKACANVVQVFARCDVELLGTGTQRVARCPFHDDRRPSLSVNTESNVYYCHGCGQTGDIFDFVAAVKSCSMPEAAQFVADLSGLDGPLRVRISEHQVRSQCPADPEGQASERASFASESPSGGANKAHGFTLKLDTAHPYLRERGLTRDAIEMFGIGYCHRGLMHGRACVPVHSPDGLHLLGYAGRWANESVPDGTAKWLLPPGLHKSQLLFNLHRLQEIDRVVLVESFWSCIRLHMMHIPVLGLMGRTISEDQISLLAGSRVTSLTLMLDGDDPGRTAVEGMLHKLARIFFVHVAELPDGEKPHSVDEKILRMNLGLA